MDISFMTSAGGGGWSLEECAGWARQHDFDCVRLADHGALDSDRILEQGPARSVPGLHKLALQFAGRRARGAPGSADAQQRPAERSKAGGQAPITRP